MNWTYDLYATPATAVLAVVCSMTAAVYDHRHGVIPNALTYPALIAGLVGAVALGGVTGLGLALAGLLAASIPFLIAFVMGGCGGGDVKLMAALGAILGLCPALDVTLAALMVGGAMAAFFMLRRIGASGLLRRLSLFALFLPAGLRTASSSLKPSNRGTIRFGVAVAAGLVWCLMLPNLAPLAWVR